MPELKHTIAKIYQDGYDPEHLAVFGPAVVRELEASFTDRNGKPYVPCLVSGKEKQAKPEEVVRQLWLRRLSEHYGYPAARLSVEVPITFGRDTSKRADIVVWDKDRPDVPYIIVEVKKLKEKEGKEQLKS